MLSLDLVRSSLVFVNFTLPSEIISRCLLEPMGQLELPCLAGPDRKELLHSIPGPMTSRPGSISWEGFQRRNRSGLPQKRRDALRRDRR